MNRTLDHAKINRLVEGYRQSADRAAYVAEVWSDLTAAEGKEFLRQTAPRHPRKAGPEYVDVDGFLAASVVRCPECGQMEWWTDDERADHGYCRTVPVAPCPVCGEESE